MVIISDIKGDKGILCNNAVYVELIKWLNKNTILSGKEFAEQGYTVQMIPVIDEIRFGLKNGKTPRTMVLNTLKELITYLEKADTVLIIN